MSFHREAMGLVHEALADTAGRTAVYRASIKAGGGVSVTVRYTSAQDQTYESDRGPIRQRELEVNVEITPDGPPRGLTSVAIGGVFDLDVDGDGVEPWTIQSFLHSDAGGGQGGFRRCLCVRPIRQGEVVGAPRRDR